MAYLLVVDDNPNNLRLLISLLSEQGYEVRPANNGARALAMVQHELPDLVLLDINMPEMDGYEVCQKLKADPQSAEIPVLFISAKDEALDKVKGFELGAVDYVSKPFDHQELLARVKTHLELKQARDQLREMNQKLQEANAGLQGLNAIKDEFLSMVSHELKNPLNSIMLFSRFMESRSMSEERAREIGRLITKTSRRMFHLIEDLLQVQALDDGQLQLDPEKFDLVAFVAELCEEYLPRAEDKQQDIKFGAELEAYTVSLDRQRLRQILENLLSNALKFSPPESEIRLQLKATEQGFELRVCDQGPGLNAEDQQKLFQKFTRLSSQPTCKEHSSGLGLYISQQLVQAMGGQIHYLDRDDIVGSCFCLQLPAELK